MSKILPSTVRNALPHPKKLSKIYRPLYGKTLEDLILYLSQICPELNSQK